MNGPSFINGKDLVACVYDSLYASIDDLMEVTDNGSKFVFEFTLLTVRCRNA